MQILTTCAFFLLGLGLSEKIQNDGMCQTIGELDLYLLLPTSAHVNRTRLNEAKELVTKIFEEDDIIQNSGVRVTSIVYKKLPKIKFQFDEVNSLSDLNSQVLDIMVRARAITRDEPPTFATQGLEFFNRYYKQTYEQRTERNAPQMLLFFVLETLNRADLTSMANNLVEISSNTDVFSFIFIANPEGASSYEKATVSLPHDSWNSLAVDDSSDILKYRDILRRCMCRAARGNLCLMGKEAKKVTEKGIIQRSAFMRRPTNVRESGATHVQTNPNSCCGGFIYSRPYDNRIQQCCANSGSKGKVTLIDEECE